MESSLEEEGGDGSGSFETRRAAGQARKKEVLWQSRTDEEVDLLKEWSEW